MPPECFCRSACTASCCQCLCHSVLAFCRSSIASSDKFLVTLFGPTFISTDCSLWPILEKARTLKTAKSLIDRPSRMDVLKQRKLVKSSRQEKDNLAARALYEKSEFATTREEPFMPSV